MLPIINIFNFDISTYAITFAIGIIFDFWLIFYINKFFNIKKLDIICCFPYWLIFFFVGAKLFYTVENIELHFNIYLHIMGSGFSFTGGIIGGFLGIILYCKQYKIKYNDLLQIYVITFPLTYSFGKIGCFSAGCCNAIYNIPLQLIESMLSFIITIYVFLRIKDKSIVYKYLMLYCISRFAFDYLRENRKIIFMKLSYIQLICILIIIVSGALWYLKNRKHEKYI